eukprot:g31987.t1
MAQPMMQPHYFFIQNPDARMLEETTPMSQRFNLVGRWVDATEDGSRTQHYGIPPSEYQQVSSAPMQMQSPVQPYGASPYGGVGPEWRI